MHIPPWYWFRHEKTRGADQALRVPPPTQGSARTTTTTWATPGWSIVWSWLWTGPDTQPARSWSLWWTLSSYSVVRRSRLAATTLNPFQLGQTTTYHHLPWGWYVGLVRGAGTWGWYVGYVGLVRGAGTWPWYVALVRGGTWGWYVALVRGPGTWGWYVGLVRGPVRGPGTWGWYVGPTYRRWEGGGRWSHVPKEGARMWWGSVTYHHLPPPTTSGSALPVDSG